jgi:hypothetical protein
MQADEIALLRHLLSFCSSMLDHGAYPQGYLRIAGITGLQPTLSCRLQEGRANEHSRN